MKKTQVDLQSLESFGKIILDSRPDGLFVSATNQNIHFHEFEQPLNSYGKMPGRFKLPLKIDLTINVTIPGLYLIINKGHLSFGTRKDNRSIGDLLGPDCTKPHSFSNEISLNKDVHISVIYGLKFMQIVVDGEARYFSKKEKYMRSEEFFKINETGLELMIASDKLAKIIIKEISLIEYDTDPDIIPYENTIVPANLANSKGVKVDFEECISCLSNEIQNELQKTNAFLLSEKSLKIKRKIEGDHHGCKISYVSPLGFSYALLISEDLISHFFWWYMVSNYKFEDKYMGRKNDLTIETIQYVQNESPEVAARLINYYDQCYGCTKGCKARTTYEFPNKKLNTCHGKTLMNMDLLTFSDLRLMISAIQKVIKE